MVNSITVCTDGKDMVESADKDMKYLTRQTIRLFVSVAHIELVVFLRDSFTVVLKLSE